MSHSSTSWDAGPAWGSANITKLLMALFLAFAGLLGVLQMSAPLASAQEEPEALGYASEVTRFDPGEYFYNGHCTDPHTPNNQGGTAVGALGAPDYNTAPGDVSIASIGNNGVLELKMSTPFGGSGDDRDDIFVTEIGTGEAYEVAVSPDGETWTDVGGVPAGNPGEKGFDVDHAGFGPYDELLYVRITDLASADISCGPDQPFSRTGADIDSVSVLTRSAYADLEIEKTSNVTAESELVAGDEITYTFTVTNTGNVDLTDVTVTDELPNLSEILPESADIAASDSVEFTATYPLTQADIDAGQIQNSASVTGNPPEECTQCDTPRDEDELITTIPQIPALETIKTSDPVEEPVAAGETITYRFEVRNTGNVTLFDVIVDDSLEGLSDIEPESIDTLAPGESGNFAATYTVGEADVLAGEIVNSATSTGTPPESYDGDDPISPPDGITIITEDPNPGLTLTKEADTEGPVAFGEPITYTFTATNTGNVTLDPVIITDELPGLSWVEGPNLGSIAPGDAAIGKATYVVTEADVLAGSVINEATGTGTPPDDCTDCAPPTSTPPPVPVDIEDPNPAIEVTKEADTDGPVALGEPITYTFIVANTGNVTLTDVTVSDLLEGLGPISPESVASLAPGDTVEFSATYDVTEADVLAGGVTNSATTTGNPPELCTDCEPPISPPSTITVDTEDPNPALTVQKEADTVGPVEVGDTIVYSFTATNTGNVTLDDVTISDVLPGLVWVDGPNLGTLAPNESAYGSATYTVTEADLLNGGVANSATGTGTPPDDLPPPEAPPSKITVPSDDPVAGLILTKDADTDGPVALGETITYTFVATNTGNVTLDPVVITDDMPGLTWVTGPNLGAIAPGDSAQGTATYVVTEGDLFNGSVVNSAIGTGTPPEGYVGDPPVNTPPSVEIPTDDPVTGLAIVKEADTAGPVGPGETIAYTFTATNTGTVTLADVVITDQLPGIEWVTGPNLGALAPGESAQGAATYLVTEADVLAGEVVNSAIGTGTPPGELPPPSSPPSTVTVETDEPASGLVLVKSSDLEGPVAVGEIITYGFVVTNTGNMTVADVTVDDPLPGLSAIEPASVESLAPGESATFTATYAVTQADVNVGGVANSAVATGVPTSGDVLISPPSDVFVPTEQGTLGLVLDKTVSPDTTVEAGDTVTYTFVATNIGNTTVSNVTISDPLPGLSDIDGPHGTSLEPGETATFTATYVVNEADAVLGVLSNTALVSGMGPDGEELSAIDTARVRACLDPQPATPTPEPTEEEIEDPTGTPEAVPTEEAIDTPDDDATDGVDGDVDGEPGEDTDPADDSGDDALPGDESGDDDGDPGAGTEPIDDGAGSGDGDDDQTEPIEDDPSSGDGDGDAPDPNEDGGGDTPPDGGDADAGGEGDADPSENADLGGDDGAEPTEPEDEEGETQPFAGDGSTLRRVLLQAADDGDLADCIPLDPDPVAPQPQQPQKPQPQPGGGGQTSGGGSPVTHLPTTGHVGTTSDQTMVIVGGLVLLAVGAIGLGLASRGTIRIGKR